MYLSKLVINNKNPVGLRSIVDPYEAHRTVWRGFPDAEAGGPGRVLFRLEHRSGTPDLMVLVQSQLRPDWDPLLSEGTLLSAEHKEVTASRILAGQLLRFRLKANPTARRIVDDSCRDEAGRPKRGRVGLFGDEQQMDWLRGKAETGGFRLVDCRVSARANSDTAKAGVRGKIRHLSVTFEGVLEVTDPDAFRVTLESGIGSAKGFGFGLLSVAPVR